MKVTAEWANFSGADFSSADLSGSSLENSSFSGVCYNEDTRWPQGFTPPPSPSC
ncbi:pentapeptide repeat-containing protein [Pseudarthrobacter polychromogenes]|uniref:pentapeptide repeat-containing protein n=1 Tax=Pseudarthrobacter polychromogenes TaxID=1676 RepID=UPI00166B6621|nr:pentapeptide repeat-containing protein [Arthrobacter sp. S1_S22]